MYYPAKLKTNWKVTGLMPAFIALVLFGFASVFFGMANGLKILGLVFLIYSVFQFIAAYRTKNIGYLISALYILSFGLYLNAVYFYNKIHLPPLAQFFFVIVLAFLVWLIYLLVTKRIKWRGREIMELAAREISQGEDSYTDRPRPVTQLEYTKETLHGFAEFLKRNLIAMPFFESDRVLFIPVKMGDEFPFVYGANINYWDKSWVAFDYDGTVSAHISKEDYLDYKENLAFDPLCEQLGKQFIQFLEFFQKGEKSRILDRVNEIKTGFFS
jgi:hypothetical protein